MTFVSIMRPFLCLAISMVCLLGMTRPLAPPSTDKPAQRAIWHWEGGTQLDIQAFEEMISEILHVMPNVPHRTDLVRLLCETAATESSFGYAVLDRSGKTYGVYQIIMPTAEYILKRLEERNPEMYAIVDGYRDTQKDLRENLTHNLHFQTAMAVSYYWIRAGEGLVAKTGSIASRAKLYKKEWNTPSGKATEAKYIRDSKRYLVTER